MQIDFHFDIVYVLCRSVGIKTETSLRIARASQYVDDAVTGGKLSLGGKEIEKAVTAHRELDKGNPRIEDGIEVWATFHFLPAGSGDSLTERMVCRTNSDNVKKLIEFCIRPPFRPELLGIALHIIADTWSHQGFSGLLSNNNDVTFIESSYGKLVAKKMEKETIGKQLFHLLKSIFQKEVTDRINIGHAEVDTNPDIPWAEWSMTDAKGQPIEVINIDRVIRAIEQIRIILETVTRDNPDLLAADKPSVDQAALVQQLRDLSLTTREGEPGPRHTAWLEAINGSQFPFIPETQIRYVPYGEIEPDFLEYHEAATSLKNHAITKMINPILEQGYRVERRVI